MANVDDLLDFIGRLEEVDKALRVAALTAHQQQKDRIFGLGKDEDGQSIGVYSKKPTYVSNRQSPRRLSGKGKTGKSKFKSGKQHTSTYFERGYFEFRSAAGRQNAHVDLRLTGSMESDYQLDAKGGEYVSGFTNRLHFAKAEGNEARFKKAIFGLSDDEKAVFKAVFEAEMFNT